VILINLNKEKNMKLLKLILIFTLGALALGAALNYTLIAIDWLFDLGVNENVHGSVADLLIAMHKKGAILIIAWPLAAVVVDFYVGLDKK
jgi:hypothetical protein